MRFYLQPRYSKKIIKIFFQENKEKPELMAIIPYKGHFRSIEFACKMEMAESIRHFLELGKKESRKSIADTMKVLSIRNPWMNLKY